MITEPRVASAASMASLVETWKRVGYRMPAILERIDFDYRAFLCGLGIDLPRYQEQRAKFLARPAADALDTLIRFFFFNEDTTHAELATIFSAAQLTDLEAIGLARPGATAGALSCWFGFYEIGGLYVVTDRELLPQSGASRVNPLLPESYEFWATTATKHVARALDLGTGSGVHALMASQHADHVIGVDISERALAFANFNKALNAITNLEFRLGDLYQGLEGQRFDLITIAPPYGPTETVAPPLEASGGPRGDAVYARALEGFEDYLTDGGIAHVSTIMIQWPDESFEQRVVRALGANAAHFDIAILALPFIFRPDLGGIAWRFNEPTPLMREFQHAPKEYGTMSMRRGPKSRGRLVHGPFQIPQPFQIDQLFDAMAAGASLESFGPGFSSR